MKKSTFLAVLFLSFLAFTSQAQLKRCVTHERMEEVFRRNPSAKLRYESMQRMLDEKVAEYLKNPQANQFRTQAIYTIPVVVHIATANPALVTDATVQAQLDTLNWYYGSQTSTDSLRVYTPFRTTFGRSSIRFCLAQRDPAGLATSGIERVTTATVFSGSSAHPSSVVPAWNTQLYLNMWVVNFGTSGILGYSYLPGTFAPGSQQIGFVADYRAFGSGASYLYSAYNGGKTCVHEIGHFFNLNHPWGPVNDPPGNPSCTLTDGCSDTPPTSGATYGCPSAIPVLNACSPTAPGIMWQNHMDYGDDACMVLFTKEQVARMDLALITAPDRLTLLTSTGCQAVVTVANDAGISAIVSPANNATSCASSLAPQVTLRNYGTNAITTVTINATVNGTAQTGYPYVWTGNLAPGATVNVTLPAVNIATGANNIVISTSQPNGSADGNSTNDSKTVTVTRSVPLASPVSEGFESTTFPPANWTLNNPNGDFTWQRTTPGRGTSLGKASINNYDNDVDGSIDEIRSPVISVTPGLSYSVSYDIAHKYYPDPVNYDMFTILVTGDCGQTYTQVYQASGPTLATNGSSTGGYTTPAAADWITRFVTIPASIVATGQVQVVFRNTNHYGNWIHLDNINISSAPPRDLRLVSINSPAVNVCSPAITPVVSVSNDGLEAITSFKIGYNINGGANLFQSFTTTIAPGASANFTLPASTAPVGADVIKAFTADPVSATGTGDGRVANDTATKAFTVFPLSTLPLVEGFETAFPPIGWIIINPNADVTWIRKTPGRASTYSAFIDNFTNNVAGRVDDMKPPFLNIASAADSVIISFDVAHKNYPGSNDLLQIGASPDCGNTYTAVYSKSGTTLATNGPLSTAYLNPVATDWRRERISLNRAFLTTSGSLGLLIRNTSAFGNNIFIDNINISSLFKRDLQLISISGVSDLICANSVSPSITVRNLGYETVTSFKIAYTLNGGSVQTQTFTGVSIPRDGQITVTLTAISLPAAGGYTLRLYSLDPVTVSGTGDLNPLNDSLNRVFSVPGITNAPLTENFVGTTFPPSGWSITNPDGAITWNRNPSGNGNAGSAYINTFRYSTTGQFDDLVTPIINYGAADSVRFSFDLSAATRNYPGSAAIPIDTLSVLVSKDCGNTFTTVYQKWGADLQTLNDPNTPQATEYFPLSPGQWRKENINLSQFASGGPLLVFFRASNNFENNIFIDNVNLTTQTLPSQLKQQGYIVYPTAFNNSFGVWFYQTPTNLKFMNVYNSAGQLVWSKKMNGTADRQMRVDLTGMAAGVYLFEIGYNDPSRNVTQKVVKY